MDKDNLNSNGGNKDMIQLKINASSELNMEGERETCDFLAQKQLFSKKMQATDHDLCEQLNGQQEVPAYEQEVDLMNHAQPIQHDYLETNFPDKIDEANKLRESDDPQSDSGQDDNRKGGHIDTLDSIFATATMQNIMPTQPQEMEQHKLQRFDTVFPYSDEEGQYGEPQVFEEQQFISDQTMNALCSPLLCSPSGHENFCMPPPQPSSPYNSSQTNSQNENNNLSKEEENILFHNREEIIGENGFRKINRCESSKDQEKIQTQSYNLQLTAIKNELPILEPRKCCNEQQNIEKHQRSLMYNKNSQSEQRMKQSQVKSPESSPKLTSSSSDAIFSDPSIKLQSNIYCSSFFQTKERKAFMTSYQLKISQKTIKLKQIDKLKIMSERGINNSRKIKLTYYTQYQNFSISDKEVMWNLPLHFCWFSRIISQTLKTKGCNLSNTQTLKNNFSLKVKQAIMDGFLYKKSQYLGKWQPRYVAITPIALYSFKEQTPNETFTIRSDLVTEIWTRFEVYEKMLVIKVQHTKKTEFAIPIVDYSKEKTSNWLWGFYQLIYSS